MTPVIRRPGAGGGDFLKEAVGDVTREILETKIRRALENHPAVFGPLLEKVGVFPELFLKTSGIFTAKAAGVLANALFNKMGVPPGASHTISQSLSETLEGSIEALAEASRMPGHSPAPAAASSTTPAAPVAAAGIMVIIAGLLGPEGKKAHAWAKHGGRESSDCPDFTQTEAQWANDHKPTIYAAGGGGGPKGGKGGGAPVKLADAELLPVKVMSVATAQSNGYEECPTCKPFQKAEKAEATAKAAAPAAAASGGTVATIVNAVAKPKIDGWSVKTGRSGIKLARAFRMSVDDPDMADDLERIDPIQFRLLADEIYAAQLKNCSTESLRPKYVAGQLVGLTDEQLHGCADTLDDATVVKVAKFVLASGGSLDWTTKFKKLVEKVEKKLHPPHEHEEPHNPWPSRIAWGVGIILAVGVLTLIVAHATTTAPLIAP